MVPDFDAKVLIFDLSINFITRLSTDCLENL